MKRLISILTFFSAISIMAHGQFSSQPTTVNGIVCDAKKTINGRIYYYSVIIMKINEKDAVLNVMLPQQQIPDVRIAIRSNNKKTYDSLESSISSNMPFYRLITDGTNQQNTKNATLYLKQNENESYPKVGIPLSCRDGLIPTR